MHCRPPHPKIHGIYICKSGASIMKQAELHTLLSYEVHMNLRYESCEMEEASGKLIQRILLAI